jgi:hypothetical protein
VPADGRESEVDELARRSTDPTASPMTFAFLNDVTASRWASDDGTPIDQTGYEFKFQPVLPFKKACESPTPEQSTENPCREEERA